MTTIQITTTPTIQTTSSQITTTQITTAAAITTTTKLLTSSAYPEPADQQSGLCLDNQGICFRIYTFKSNVWMIKSILKIVQQRL